MSKLRKHRLLVATVAIGLTAGLTACKNESKDKMPENNAAGADPTQSETPPRGANPFKSDDDKASYAIGFSGGDSMKRELSELELKTFVSGFTDGFKGNEPKLDKAEMGKAIQALQARKMAEMQEKSESAKTENKSTGEKFLAENKARAGVIFTESGLQYEVIKAGTGASPTKDDTVSVHYHGTLIDGTVFDSSVDRGTPATFGVGQVIKGWTEALQLMKVGGKWKLTIPSDLAYGDRGAGAKIGPNAVLIFEVELLDIVKK